MPYRLDPARPLRKAVRKAANDQIDKAIAELTAPDADRNEAVHDARKRLKKLRGLLRVVKPSAPDIFEQENAHYRDLARTLSDLRDRTALIEALDGLRARYADEAEERSFTPLRDALVARRGAVAAQEDLTEEALAPTVRVLREGRAALGDLSLPGHGRKTLRAGLAANIAKARSAMVRAKRSGEADDFHELRKRMKYLAMHLKLLNRDWPEGIGPLRRMADRIADDLGRDHDYAVLRAEMDAPGPAMAKVENLSGIVGLLERHSIELRRRSLHLAERLLCERPADFARRLTQLHALAATRD
ncbi:CHAD domain-containing protein [Aureimonas mangrovi]|uniref:CHAD domain-containing protein n=1 Tax=Aureimonas mangrovi TaxID=2758041 RepID=UPI00163D9B3A|nr:CHAD domain-containing protein [Aureimonas mangrovi]